MVQVLVGELAVDAGQSDQQPANSAEVESVRQRLEAEEQHGVLDPHVAFSTDETLKEGTSCVKQSAEESEDFEAKATLVPVAQIKPDYGGGEDDFLQ